MKAMKAMKANESYGSYGSYERFCYEMRSQTGKPDFEFMKIVKVF